MASLQIVHRPLLNLFDISYVIIMDDVSLLPILIAYCTDPRGKKSIPTICYTNELFPDDWLPTATIFGNFIYDYKFISRSLSTKDITDRNLDEIKL